MQVIYKHRYLVMWDTGAVEHADEVSANMLNQWDCTIVDLLENKFFNQIQQAWFEIQATDVEHRERILIEICC